MTTPMRITPTALLLLTLCALLLPLSSWAQSSSSTGAASPASSSSTAAAAASAVASTGSSTVAVLPYVQSFTGRYDIDWSLVPVVQPALSIPSDTDLGTCICDLTWASCDVNCECDADCSVTERNRFSASLPEGPVSQSVLTCVDPDLVTINKRGALTVSLVNNMLCVAEDNNPSLGDFIVAPTGLSDSEFSAAKSSEARFNFEPVDPSSSAASSSSSSDDSNYKVSDVVGAAKQDLTATSVVTFYITQGGQFVVPTPSPDDGSCSDSNYLRYLSGDVRACARTTTSLASACVAGGIFSGARYVANIKVAKIRTAVPSIPTQYVSANISAVYYTNPLTGTSSFLMSQSYGATTTPSANATAGFSVLGAFTMPEPTWNASACTCSNVLLSVQYTVTHEAGGSISSAPAPNIVAYLTSITNPTATCTGAASITQTYTTKWQLSDSLVSSSVQILRPKSGNPGYVVGLPVLSGVLTSLSSLIPSATNPLVTTTSTLYAIAQDTKGLTILPTTADGMCSLSSTLPASSSATTSTVHSVGFGQDSKFGCWVSLDLLELQALCLAGVGSGGVTGLFGNISTSLGIWGNSDFKDINQWLSVKQGLPVVGTWSASTRTCAGLTTGVNIEIATVDAGAFKNAQTRILSAQLSYTTSTWQFTGEDATLPQRFPVFATATFIHVPIDGLHQYTPSAPPLLPKFPNDLLYPLYIESAATSSAVPSLGVACAALFAVLFASRRL